jgi:4-hydroxybenzoate polyprenyltransferase
MYLFGPYIVGLLIGARVPEDALSWKAAAFGVFFLFPANLLVYGVNDVHDFETDSRNDKKTGYEGRLPLSNRALHQARLLRTIAACSAPWLVLAAFATPPLAVASMAAWLFLSHQYSAPPIRAKARPFVDSLFNGLYACPAFFAYALAGGHNVAVLWVVAAWAWTAAMHAYSAVPDIGADTEAGVPTIATRLGFRGTIALCAALYAFAAATSYTALGPLALLLGAVYLAMMGASALAPDARGVMRFYRWFPALNTTAGFLLFWRIAWIKFQPNILSAIS